MTDESVDSVQADLAETEDRKAHVAQKVNNCFSLMPLARRDEGSPHLHASCPRSGFSDLASLTV